MSRYYVADIEEENGLYYLVWESNRANKGPMHPRNAQGEKGHGMVGWRFPKKTLYKSLEIYFDEWFRIVLHAEGTVKWETISRSVTTMEENKSLLVDVYDGLGNGLHPYLAWVDLLDGSREQIFAETVPGPPKVLIP